jgi:hypothetical protein
VPTPGLAGSSPPCLADSVSPGLLLRVLQTLSRPVFRLCVRSVWPALCPAFSFRGVWLHRDTNAPTSRRSRAWWEAALFPVCARGVSCRIARSVGARTPPCMQRGFRRATKGRALPCASRYEGVGNRADPALADVGARTPLCMQPGFRAAKGTRVVGVAGCRRLDATLYATWFSSRERCRLRSAAGLPGVVVDFAGFGVGRPRCTLGGFGAAEGIRRRSATCVWPRERGVRSAGDRRVRRHREPARELLQASCVEAAPDE